jgi:hypothetical protein
LALSVTPTRGTVHGPGIHEGPQKPWHQNQYGRTWSGSGQHLRRKAVAEAVKYEEVYLKEYRTPLEARISQETFFWHHNNERPYQKSLDDRTSCEVYSLSRSESTSQYLRTAGPITLFSPPGGPKSGKHRKKGNAVFWFLRKRKEARLRQKSFGKEF